MGYLNRFTARFALLRLMQVCLVNPSQRFDYFVYFRAWQADSEDPKRRTFAIEEQILQI